MSAPGSIKDYFNKRFDFTGNERWDLPKVIYNSQVWEIETLQRMKTSLNNVKGQLNKFDLNEWSKHTKARDPSSYIIPALKQRGSIELLTQAWCKFYECLNQYPIIPAMALSENKVTSVHLCEAPGAFVSALNRFLYTHFRQVEWRWQANTLNPYYEGNTVSEMITDDRLIRHTLKNWNFGLDETGDLMKYYNHQALVQRGPASLVTADGSIDCMNDPGEQERNVHFLHYCETMTALKILNKHGTFVLKIFTIFEHATICLIYLLACSFRKVHLFKPCSSKSGNSEVYVICLDYKGRELFEGLWEQLLGPYQGCVSTKTVSMFPLDTIDPDFLKQVEECGEYFMSMQCFTINENIRHFLSDEESNRDQLKTDIAESFITLYPISYHIPKRCRMIKYFKRNWKPCSEIYWDFKSINVTHETAYVERGLQMNVKVGRAIEKVVTSRFCRASNINCDVQVDNELLFQAIFKSLSSNYTVINNTNFNQNSTHYASQRKFFHVLKEIYRNTNNDIVIIAVPLLTRFLVGILYILAIGFETVLVYKKGALVLHGQVASQKNLIERYISMIEVIYGNLDYQHKLYVPDILEIVASEMLETGTFYEMICRYNDGIYEQ